jgi:hypothetical protein
VLAEASNHLVGTVYGREGEIGPSGFVQRRRAALTVVPWPWSMHIDLLCPNSIRTSIEWVAESLGVLDAFHPQRIDVERMSGAPVMDVDDDVIEIVEDHRDSLVCVLDRAPSR